MDQKTTTNINSVAANTATTKILIIKEKRSYLRSAEGGRVKYFKTADLLAKRLEASQFDCEHLIIKIQCKAAVHGGAGCTLYAEHSQSKAYAEALKAKAYASVDGAEAYAGEFGAKAYATVKGAKAYATSALTDAYANAAGAEAYAEEFGAAAHATVKGAKVYSVEFATAYPYKASQTSF